MNDRLTARRFREISIDRLQKEGLDASIEWNMSNWEDEFISQSDGLAFNLSLSDKLNNLSSSNAFWIRLRHEGETVAICGNRLFEVDDYIAEIAAGRIHKSKPGIADRWSVEPGLPAEWGGRIGQAGGLWVAKAWRKRGLSWIVPRLVRSWSVSEWDVDRQCAIIMSFILEKGLDSVYAFDEYLPLVVDRVVPYTGKVDRAHVAHISRRRLVEQLGEATELLSRHHDKDVSQIAAIDAKRPAYAKVA